MEQLEKAQARGKRIPALESRPEVPLWLLPAMDAWIDLGGAAPWWRVREWCNHYGIELEWLAPVLRRAAAMLNEHVAKGDQKRGKSPSSRTRSRH